MEKYFNLENGIDYKKLLEVAKCVVNGGIVIFPTETVYGIGVNAFNKDAVKKLYEIKKRPLNKPISLLVSDFEMIKRITKNITDLELKLMERYFPGPFTIVLEKKDIIPNIVTSGGNTVGIRMPEEKIARELIRLSGVPIATPSANISGKKSGTNYESIIKDFHEKIDYFIDTGESKIGLASTIVKVIDEKPIVLREGFISKSEIEEFCILYNNK